MTKKDLASEIRRARDSTYLHLGLGSCWLVFSFMTNLSNFVICDECLFIASSSVPVGRVTHSAEHIKENVLAATKGVSASIPKGWSNIRSIHLKTVDSIALPLHSSLPNPPTVLPQADDPGIARVKRVRLESVEEKEEEDEDTTKQGEGERGDADVVKRKRSKSKLAVKKVKGSTVLRSKPGDKRRSKTAKRSKKTLA